MTSRTSVKFLRFFLYESSFGQTFFENPAKMALFALAEINYCQGKFFPLVAEIADGTADASRVAVVKSCLLWPKCRMVWPKSREHVLPIAPLVAVIAFFWPFQIFEICISATRGESPMSGRHDHPLKEDFLLLPSDGRRIILAISATRGKS